MTLTPLARTGGGERLITTLNPNASRVYAEATLRVVGHAERRLGPSVIANRIDATGRPEPWRQAHARWRRDLRAAIREGSDAAVFQGDVRDCYGSVTASLVSRQLRAVGVDANAARLVLDLLDACAGQGSRGLPVGPAASGVLANVVLAVVDDHLHGAGLRHRRWVDDVMVMAPDRRGATAAHDAFRRGLDELGLEPNLAKTRVLVERPDILRVATGSEISPRGAGGMG